MAFGLQQLEVILRTQVEAVREKIGPFEIGAPPGYVAFIQNMSAEQVIVNLEGSTTEDGTYYAEYGQDTPVTIEAYGREIVVISDVPKYIGLHLDAVSGDGVKVTLISFTNPNFDARKDSLII